MCGITRYASLIRRVIGCAKMQPTAVEVLGREVVEVEAPEVAVGAAVAVQVATTEEMVRAEATVVAQAAGPEEELVRFQMEAGVPGSELMG